MRRYAPLFALTLACLCPGARAATFTIRQVEVQGSTAVTAVALNDHGDFVGTVVVGGGSPIGFEQSGSTFTQIEGLCGIGTCQGYPTSINKTGTITGLCFGAESGGFIWQNGGFVAADFFTTGNPSNLISGPWVNNRGRVAYNMVSNNSGIQIYAGMPGRAKLQQGIGLSTTLSILSGFNNAGVLVGITDLPQSGETAFAGRDGIFADLPVFSVNGTPDIVINDHNVVAGSTSNGIWIYTDNTESTFAMPVQTSGVTVTAINNSGRIVGSFIDQGAGVQRAFFYANGTVLSFGSYPLGDTVHVAINNAGRMLVSDLPQHSNVGTSYLVHCHGTGC
jgi:probable HAF family extracellular repeat protein